jgi:hypothetical protein
METSSPVNNSNDIKLFKKKLKYLYKKVDTASSLLWSHESHLTGAKRLRSKDDKDDKQMKWKNKETQQTGYGEISMVSNSNSIIN